MSDFQGMDDLMHNFLVEAANLLSGVDNKLVDLEKAPGDRALLNDVFRGFHTIKGGAGFLYASELVTLCHLAEGLFDRLRNGELDVTPEIMDVVLDAAATVRDMFGYLERGVQPPRAEAHLLQNLNAAIAGETSGGGAVRAVAVAPVMPDAVAAGEPDWNAFHAAVIGVPVIVPVANGGPESRAANQLEADAPSTASGRRATDRPHSTQASGRRMGEKGRENAIRVDIARLDQVLSLSDEIGLTKNRLNALRSDILNGKTDGETLHALDAAVSQLDLLVSELQNAVMKTRMQPLGRLFQKYLRIVRDLARSRGKKIEMELVGEDTEIDKTMIEDLSDPIIHLLRNAVDHGVETPSERLASGKPEKAQVRLEAHLVGGHIVLMVSDDGRGMNSEELRAMAVEKGLITDEQANTMDGRQSLNLVLLPGFSAAGQVSDGSGGGVGMDVVTTKIQKLDGTIDIRSTPGKGTRFTISLPLTQAILPVLLVRLGAQPFALPLSMVREILPVQPDEIHEIGGRATMVVRGEVLSILSLASLLGGEPENAPAYGVLMQAAETRFILAIDSFAGREDAVIESLEDPGPSGVAGVTTLSNGQIVPILDIEELLASLGGRRGVSGRALLPKLSEAA